ncbi:MAG: UDP-N-acetylmuramoyl-L-alanine--D-glutamate ligase [Puniceicoccales bacterium]|jgi:UDP-N-acetylmuramoylalanine--D-glutamate ligase|nr:UDP-N-acetylmuramoyl-L-alanine--D-glutamate ligase [Puniceicoccales bacterium]
MNSFLRERCVHLHPLKPVAILGKGVSGLACARLLKHLNIPYEIFDQQGPQLPVNIQQFALCIFSPGFPPYHPWLKSFYRAYILCVNELDFAATYLENPLIAVTGTNGKTSVTECLSQIFLQQGQAALAVGNNGDALSNIVLQGVSRDAYLLCEVSSFQAWGLRYLSPSQVLWTNLSSDHLNYHRSFSHYLRSKAHLARRCLEGEGHVFFGPSLQNLLHVDLHHPHAHFMPVPTASDQHWVQQFPLKFSVGQMENFHILKYFCEFNKIPFQILEHCLRRFKQPSHRLHKVGTVQRVEFWEDSKATNLHALQAALDSFKDCPNIHWILGGQSKGEHLNDYVKVFEKYPNVQKIYLIGETGSHLYALFSKNTSIHATCILSGSLKNIFKTLRIDEEKAAIVFSPGFASWDQFKNYAERGAYFETLVAQISESENEIRP